MRLIARLGIRNSDLSTPTSGINGHAGDGYPDNEHGYVLGDHDDADECAALPGDHLAHARADDAHHDDDDGCVLKAHVRVHENGARSNAATHPLPSRVQRQ